MSSVSVVLCTYNGERFLQEQLDSIANQTRLPDEVVVGDDGSTDGTLAILEAWKDSVPFPVKICQNPQNLGHTKNFEVASRASSGDVLFFCDQDDVWHADKIELVMEIFDRQNETGIVFHNTAVVDEAGVPTGLDELQLRGRGNRLCSLRFFCPVDDSAPIVSGCCCAIRRDLLMEMLPFFCAHDVCIYALGRVRTHIETILDPLMDYRFHSKNVSLCESWEKQCARDTELERTLYKLDVPRFWGHFSEIEEYKRRISSFPDSPAKTERLKFLRFLTSHLTNRSRIQRNALIFAPLFLWEVISWRYFRRNQPFRSMIYDLLCGLKLRKVEQQ